MHCVVYKGSGMTKYYVNRNAQSNGDHEVHKEGCSYVPDENNRRYLGDFLSCQEAISEAEKLDPQADGCYYCTLEFHTR